MPQTDSKKIPIIDLFAGPGGLGEGFSRYVGVGGRSFKIHLSVEKDPYAHRTLRLRAFFRQFTPDKVPDAYYNYLRGKRVTFEDLERDFPAEMAAANEEAICRTLGDEDTEREIRDLIESRTKGSDWVLIGGPPCQAYSSMGRARMLGLPRKPGELQHKYDSRLDRRRREFEKDHRHFLYREYLKIIADHWPSVFVMENVKGILSAKIDGRPILPGILHDLRNPSPALGRKQSRGHTYRLHSFVAQIPEDPIDLDPRTLLIKAEEYGVPQARHRVIILGIRDDIQHEGPGSLKRRRTQSVEGVIGGLPKLAPSISEKHVSDLDSTKRLIRELEWLDEIDREDDGAKVISEIHEQCTQIWTTRETGKQFVRGSVTFPRSVDLAAWYDDPRLGGICNHESRGHMPEDLRRYFFSACFARAKGRSPKLQDFPSSLLPNHENVKRSHETGQQKFADRFRVQLGSRPSTTIMSHIANDGHYYIHPDPRQARSLTVREAARLQTFPDNYFFEGPRTQQYRQVGNAVPPFLAFQIAEIVSEILKR